MLNSSLAKKDDATKQQEKGKEQVDDFSNRGYEYLRVFTAMQDLHNKLLMLDYQGEFCATYKCPPINRYYFSTKSSKENEQRYIFVSLCAWLIKSKCQMNFDLKPDDYDSLEDNISIILNAIHILFEENSDNSLNPTSKVIDFRPSRLKYGFGPEVIWTLNILSDRALELMFDNMDATKKATNETSYSQSITIGQPFVGGGLTSRPIGSYKLYDESLEFDDHLKVSRTIREHKKQDILSWYRHVDEVAGELTIAPNEDNVTHLSYQEMPATWYSYINRFKEFLITIESFENCSSNELTNIASKISADLRIIKNKEDYLHSSIKDPIEKFQQVWTFNKNLSNTNLQLKEQVDSKTSKFLYLSEKLAHTIDAIHERQKRLIDQSELKKLEESIVEFREKTFDLEVKNSLMVSIYMNKMRTNL